jgi:hypothetical protein
MVERVREAQRYCSARCRDLSAKRRRRYRSMDTVSLPTRSVDMASSTPPPRSEAPTVREFGNGPTPGALQGDDYQLDCYPDSYPKLRMLRPASPGG